MLHASITCLADCGWFGVPFNPASRASASPAPLRTLSEIEVCSLGCTSSALGVPHSGRHSFHPPNIESASLQAQTPYRPAEETEAQCGEVTGP